MIMRLYTIFDRVAQESGPSFEAKTDGVARRKYDLQLASSPYREDFELLCIGEIDHESNVLQGLVPYVVQVPAASDEEAGTDAAV